MSLIQLRTFIEVYRHQSISDAAKALELTQPAVSQHIASLETQLARPLFERHARGVKPTAIADSLAARIGSSLDTAEAALAEARARSDSLHGTLHLAGHADHLAESMAPHIPPLLEAGLELNLHNADEEELLDMLADDRADLAVTASEPKDRRLESKQIGCERFVLVATSSKIEKIQANDSLARGLNDVPYLAYNHEKPLIAKWFKINQIELPEKHPAVTTMDLRLLRNLASLDVGWAVIPEFLCRQQLADGSLSILPAPISIPENPYYLCWHKSSLRNPRISFARNLILDRVNGQTKKSPAAND